MGLFKIIYFFTLLFFLKSPLFSTESHIKQKSFHIQLVEKAVLQYQQKNNIPGIAVVLYYQGKPYFLPFGSANLRSKKPITENTIFELGSITKSFTAILLAVEVLDGKIKLSDPVARYLPGLREFTGPFSKVTFQHLATHTSGFMRVIPEKDRKTYADIVKYLRNWHPTHSPGTHYEYSNFGFGILGLALENVFQKNYFNLLSINLLNPLQMNHTFLVVPQQWQADYAQGYDKNGNPAEKWPITLMQAAGALRSSAADMRKFLAACLNLPGTPSKIAEAIYLTETGNFKMGANKTQVMSWMKTDFGSYSLYTKNGGVTGFATFMGFIPELQIGLVIMANKNVSNTLLGQYILQQLGSSLAYQKFGN